MKYRKASKVKIVLSFIIGILLMFSVMASTMSLFVKDVVIKPNTYIKIFKEREIPRQVHEFLNGNLNYILTVNNIPSEVNKDVVTMEEVEEVLNTTIIETVNYFSTGSGSITEVNVDKYLDRFNNNIMKFIKENAIHIDNNLKEQIESLKVDVGHIIKNELQIVNLSALTGLEAVGKVGKFINLFVTKLYFIPIVATGVLIMLLLLVWRQDLVGLSKWIGNGFMSGGLAIFIVFYSGYVSKFYYNITIDTIYLRDFISAVIKEFLFKLSVYGLIVLLIGVLLLIPQVMQYIKRSKMKRKEIYSSTECTQN